MPTSFPKLLEVLTQGQVDFIVVGGVAVVAHGHSRMTKDLDICYSRELANLDRLANALSPFDPYLRGAPPGLPFVLDSRTLRSGLNFTLRTKLGDIDLLGELTGVGTYSDIVGRASPMRLFGQDIKIIHIDDLERAKQAAGRPQDLFDLEALRIIRNRK